MGDHYVPAFYLRGFSDDGYKGKLWSYRKENESDPFLANIDNLANENRLYPPQTEQYLADDIEAPANEVIRKIALQGKLSSTDKEIFSKYMVVLWKRIPQTKDWIRQKAPAAFNSVFKQLDFKLKQFDEENPMKSQLVETRRIELNELQQNSENLITQEFITNSWLNLMCAEASPDVWKMLSQMTWTFFIISDTQFFITGDNPVFHFSSIGIAQQRSEVSFPITNKIALWATWRSDLKENEYLHTNNQVIKEINRRTASIAKNFLYSSRNEKWVMKLANKNQFPLHFII